MYPILGSALYLRRSRLWMHDTHSGGGLWHSRMREARLEPMADPLREQVLMEKIRDLSADKVTEVEDFVDFLRQRDSDRRLVQAAGRLSEESLHKVWDNPEDADYDRL